jgi:hypothetical protein
MHRDLFESILDLKNASFFCALPAVSRVGTVLLGIRVQARAYYDGRCLRLNERAARNGACRTIASADVIAITKMGDLEAVETRQLGQSGRTPSLCKGSWTSFHFAKLRSYRVFKEQYNH